MESVGMSSFLYRENFSWEKLHKQVVRRRLQSSTTNCNKTLKFENVKIRYLYFCFSIITNYYSQLEMLHGYVAYHMTNHHMR